MRFSTRVGISAVMLVVPGLVFAEQAIDNSKEPSYLFVLSATSGSSKGNILSLEGVPSVIYFSERPARIAGHMTLSAFIEMWAKGVDSFKADPPNATLSVLKEEGVENVVVELISVVHKSDSVIFKVAVLEGTIPESFRTTSLFIDFQSNTPTL